MAELKWANNIITEPKAHPPAPGVTPLPDSASRITRLLYVDADVLKGSFYYETVWYIKGADTGPGPHTHDFDEILGFIGYDPKNPRELGGEFEFWIEDEKYMLNKTCMVFVPKGVKHCPLIARKITTPVLHFTTGNSTAQYQKTVFQQATNK